MKPWRKQAIEDLYRYRSRKTNIIILEAELKEVENSTGRKKQTGLGVMETEENSMEKSVEQIIARKDMLKQKLAQVKLQVKKTEAVLNILSEREQYLLDVCYINPREDYFSVIMKKYCIETAQANRYIHNALLNYWQVRSVSGDI